MNIQRMIITVLVCQGVSLLFFGLFIFLPYPNPIELFVAGLLFGTISGALALLAEWVGMTIAKATYQPCPLCQDTRTFYDPASGLDKPCTRC